MARRIRIAVLASIALLASGAADAQERLAVIVSADRSAELSREEVAQIFLKKRRFWSAGEPIVPVNRNASSKAREIFTRRIFDQEARFLRAYWNRQYFQGVLPPLTLASDEAVKRFVAQERNAIGYVDEKIVDSSVRVLFVLEGAPASAP